ncbi:MAG: ester cyclase [Pseudomonadota bacterium]
MDDMRGRVRASLCALITTDEKGFRSALDAAFHKDVVVDMAYPVEQLVGREALAEAFLQPLRRAFDHARRRDELFLGGANTRADGGDWVASVTHYVGRHSRRFLGAPPSDKLAFLRSGEFWRVEDGKICEGKVIFDLPDLMRQAGASPFPSELGTEMLFPSPETHDGVCPEPSGGLDALNTVERMFAGLHRYDPVTFASIDQVGPTGTWTDNFMWYGPSGIGSNTGWDGFVRDHRASFLRAFPDRAGGNHYCRISDGAYAAVSGWPSMTMTHRDTYLGIPPTGRPLTLRVMDFYRCEGPRIAENWVLLDYGDLYRQMGGDIFAPAQREVRELETVR